MKRDAYFLAARDFEPAYLRLYRSGELQRRAEAALAGLAHCLACPRDCGVDRLRDKTAACKTGRYARVASYFPHFGEEDCLRGWNGSGTIFFSMCNLRCVFCLHPDTFISTSFGLQRIADLFAQAGAATDGPDEHIRFFHSPVDGVTRLGQRAAIVKVFRHQFAGELVRIKPFNCPPLQLTPGHEVFAVLKTEPERAVKLRADQLSKDYYLVVPRRVPGWANVELDVREILSSQSRRFRKAPPRRVSVRQLGDLFARPLTSSEVAQATGYHPAYIRRLRGQWRRGLLAPDGDSAWAQNGLVMDEESRIRFKTERRPGIPVRIALDERMAWLLGAYCAEGHITAQKDRPNSHRLIFSFGRHESDFAQRVRRLLQDLFGVRCSMVRRRTTVTVEVGKASLALLFGQLCGRGSREKRVPAGLIDAPAEVLRAFLGGLIEGDGYDNGSHWVVNTVSEDLAVGLFEVGLLLGTLPSYHRWQPSQTKRIEGRTVRQAPLYYVKIPKGGISGTPRRMRWRETKDCYLVPIHRIDRMQYDGPVYNLEIEDADHSYVAPFVAVGNCQNYDISQAEKSPETPPERLAAMMLELQEMGCHNINFVTPEHVVPQILEALPLAVARGLRLPLVYNTSAYDALESLRHMDGVVDIYMPDFKMWDERLALRYLLAKDYPEAARRAIREMHRQVGPLRLDERGLAQRGVLVRHLVMPGGVAGTRQIMEFLAREVSPDTYVNLMDQYRPAGRVSREKFAEINRPLQGAEMRQARAEARAAGLRRFDERRPRAWP